MRHFGLLSDDDHARLFSRRPEPFGRTSDVPTLGTALGATLYMPATRPHLARDLARQAAAGVVSSVVCLEDSVADTDLPAAQANAIEQLREFARRRVGSGRDGEGDGGRGHDDGRGDGDAPLVFVRVRRPEQIPAIVSGLGDHAGLLSGFVLPKFTDSAGAAYLDVLADTVASSGRRLLAMPVIESPEMIHRETREDALAAVQRLLDKHRDLVVAVRIGATDLCSAYGIRRDRDLTIYDVRVVAEVISDVVNALGRADGTGFIVTGPVWEYFHSGERLFKPQLRQTPFDETDARTLRHHLITEDLDGLIREVVLDKANGLTGKTVIHPSHVAAVHALSVVTHEEFADATDIAGFGAQGGAMASTYGNKMNESKPHNAWAERTLRRARVFGVAAEDVSFVDLLSASALP
jgi:citrate lyase beta subunit